MVPFICDDVFILRPNLSKTQGWEHIFVHPFGMRVFGTLPDGYLHTNPLPQILTKQSVPTSKICLPSYFGLPIVIPTLHRIVGPAIARARIPW